jgi:hypothetical protein
MPPSPSRGSTVVRLSPQHTALRPFLILPLILDHPCSRNDKTVGVATGDEPQSMYMVTSGTHYNDKCCFDCTTALF